MKDIVIIAHFSRDFTETDNGRFMYLCKALSRENKVEIITSDFSHGKKQHKEVLKTHWPFKITFLHEPGYKKSVSILRFVSHWIWGREVGKYLYKRQKPDIVYCAVPSLTGPLKAAKYCEKNKIRFVIDIQDLWPEAFQMVLKIPVLARISLEPFKVLADGIYKRADAICGVSKTYVNRALQVSRKCEDGIAVFLGTELSIFDDNTKKFPVKKDNGIWVGYCGAMGESYDLDCVIDALAFLDGSAKLIAVGDGPKKELYKKHAKEKQVPSVFTGKLPYERMCGWLKACDIAVNPITRYSAASIINKHGDYAAAGLPVLNTQESEEFRNLVDVYGMGFNCKNGDPEDLAEKLRLLIDNPELRKQMGSNARSCAEKLFDREKTYQQLINCILA